MHCRQGLSREPDRITHYRQVIKRSIIKDTTLAFTPEDRKLVVVGRSIRIFVDIRVEAIIEASVEFKFDSDIIVYFG